MTATNTSLRLIRRKACSKTPKATNDLCALLEFRTRFIGRSYLRTTIRNSVARTACPGSINSQSPPFYRQGLVGNTNHSVVREFCQLADNSAKTIIRIQIEAAPELTLQAEKWELVFLHCIAFYDSSAPPAFVITGPDSTNQVELFVLGSLPLTWPARKAEDLKTLNRMISLQVIIRLTRPFFHQINHETDMVLSFTPVHLAPYITWTIYDLLAKYRPQTIHQLAEQLLVHYQIEASYRFYDHFFSKLCFRYKQSDWIPINALGLGSEDIRAWLNANRLFKSNLISDQQNNVK